MSDPIIQANASLVLNGEFYEGYEHWVEGSTNPSWIDRGDDSYNGEVITYLIVGNQASVSQVIEVPKDLRANANYILSFLCESWHYAAGRVEVRIEGSSEPAQVITIPPGRSRNSQAQPMEFKPVGYEVELTLPLKQNDRVRVSVISPASRDDEYEMIIFITRIKILLHLEPLVLQQLTFDDQPLSPERPLYLCLGASGSYQHRLGFVPAPDNAWLDTHASLNSEDNPQGAIVATPMLGVDHPLDDQWLLDCPLIEGDGPHEFSFNLLNKYTADAYPIRVSFGHHRLAFREVLEAAYYPVLEYQQRVRLGVQVASHYTGEPLDGRTVNWGVRGQRQTTSVLTDGEGWAYFDYAPARAGDVVIEASVESLYYASGVFTQGFDVRVLATDPWKEIMAVIDGKAARWDEKTGYPNRGTHYPVTVKLPDDSPLLETELWLQWEGDSAAELGVTVSPQLEEPVPVSAAELTWTLTCDDRLDGKFDLLLGCSKLLLASSKKPMSLARNRVEIGDVREANKSPVVDEQESVLLMVQALHILASGPGDPVVNALVDWVGPNGTVSTVTGAGGWASVLDTPKNAGAYTITANVRAHVDMPPVEREFAVTALASSPWKDKVLFHLDNEPVDRATVGIACLRDQSHTFRVTPTAGSPVKDKPMSLTLRDGAPDLGLTIGVPTATSQGGWEWRLSSGFSTSRSGLFELSLTSTEVSGARELSGRLLSENLADEGHIVLDQVSATVGNQTLYPCLGALHRYNFLPHALSPLIGLNLKLEWSGKPADELGVTVTPELHLPQAISAGGAAWALDFSASQNNGQFALALALPQLSLTSTANVMQLAHNKVRIEALHEAAVDPVVGQDRAWLWVQVVSAFTRQPVAQVPVRWRGDTAPDVVNTDTRGWSGYAFTPVAAQRYDVEAQVSSPYDDYQDKRSMIVNALASDPWQELKVSFDLQPAQDWGAKTYFPRRKGEHSLKLSVPEGSPLLDQYVTLGLTGTGPAELGLSFASSALGVPQLMTHQGLSYTLKGGDLKNGSFALRLAASRLSNLSSANALSLGSGSQVLKIIGNNRVHQTLDWGQELYEQVTVVSAVSGKPMSGWTVTWRSPDLGAVTTVTDFYGVTRINFTPKTPGAAELRATVGDEVYSESASLAFVVNEPREIKTLVRVGQGAYPGEEGEAQATMVSALTGQPLSNVEVMWEFAGLSLAPTRTDAEGKASVRFRLGAPGDAVLVASVRGGLGGWDTASLLFTTQEDALLLEGLSTEKPTVYLGEEAAAQARVVYGRSGAPAHGAQVSWSFPQLQLLPSLTDADGSTSVKFKPANIGTFDLIATTSGSGSASKSQAFTVLDPLTDPTHAKVAAVTASKNPVGIREYVTFTARIVATVSGDPMPGREVFYSVAGSGYLSATTDHKGELSRIYSPLEAGGLSFSVELRNPGGTTESGSVTVTVENLSEPESRT
ncbi:hypothetical protein [Pseudomonas purpurea]|uniref:hypothetical protein n=1 Tax=Pseudomonas purpurea TaxID=3136737 RepID=UPI003266306B